MSSAVRERPRDQEQPPEGRRRRWPADWLPFVMGGVGLVTFLLHGWDAVFTRDLALYSYAGQTVADGVPPYVGVLNRAGPLAHLLPSIGVLVARTYGGDEVFALRFFYMLVSVVAVGVAYVLGRDVFRSRLAGLVTSATFLSFHAFILYATGGPREKTPMVLFIMLALWAASRRKWMTAGVFVSLATLTLQIAFFLAFPAVLLAVGTVQRSERVRAGLRVVVGGIVPLAVTAVYFAVVGALSDFVLGFLILNAHYNRASSLLTHLGPDWASLRVGYGVSLWFLLLGLVLVLAFSVAALRVDRRRASPWIVFVAALGPAVVIDLFWNFRDFDSWADAIPLLPVAALGFGAVVKAVQERLSQRAAWTVGGAWLVLTLVTALVYSISYHDARFVAQRRSVTAVLAQVPANATVLSIEAPQALVLTDRRNPSRYQMFTGGMENYVDDQWPGGLDGYARWILRTRPDLVTIGPNQYDVWGSALGSGYTWVGCAPEWRWYASRTLSPQVLAALRRASPC
ncbi:MAG: hypothetical protein QOK15_6 [Nocardioidaceae bacterium]|nr:hypothetical protein [Nocardioidaceae bacterium]